MPNGKRGDHPLTDILDHQTPVYGQEADELIRKIRDLCSRRELHEWWERELGWTPDPALALPKARAEHARLLTRAREGGWETPP
jgi:hypothetical protein